MRCQGIGEWPAITNAFFSIGASQYILHNINYHLFYVEAKL